MIKVENNQCSINGDEIIAELEFITEHVLEELDTIDKFILLHLITKIINDSIKGTYDDK